MSNYEIVTVEYFEVYGEDGVIHSLPSEDEANAYINNLVYLSKGYYWVGDPNLVLGRDIKEVDTSTSFITRMYKHNPRDVVQDQYLRSYQLESGDIGVINTKWCHDKVFEYATRGIGHIFSSPLNDFPCSCSSIIGGAMRVYVGDIESTRYLPLKISTVYIA